MQPVESVVNKNDQTIAIGPMFTKQELAAYKKYSPTQRTRKLKMEFLERISRAPYSSMSGYEKYIYCESQISALKGGSNGCIGGCLGMVLATFLSAALGGVAGVVIFFLISAGGAYVGNQLAKPHSTLILPLLEKELIKNKSQYEEQSKAHEAIRAKEEDQEKTEHRRKEAIAHEEASNIFNRMLKDPKLIRELFPSYREYVLLEIRKVTPDSSAVKKTAESKELGNAIMAGVFGIYGDSYTPSEDSRFRNLIQMLDRERSRIKELAHAGAHLPFGAIEHFQETSRTYFGLQREGGGASIYDEQMIQNEVIAMKESLSVNGNYNDNSTRIDKSTYHTTNVQNAVIDNGEYDEQRIKKEILKIVIASDHEASSRAELLASIPVKESRLLAALEDLQQSGMLQIGNRSSGEIVYKLDRLA